MEEGVFKIIFILKQSQIYRKIASVVYQSGFCSIYNNIYVLYIPIENIDLDTLNI